MMKSLTYKFTIAIAGLCLSGLSLCLSAANLLRSEAGNVSSTSFALLFELDERADARLAIYDAAEGGTDISAQLRTEWYPVERANPAIPGSGYSDRSERYGLQEQMAERGLLLVRVLRALPATTYFAELAIWDDASQSWQATPRLPVTTAARTTFVAEARQILVDLTAAGIELGGTIIRASHPDSPYPLFSVVGDIPGAGRAYVDLSHLLHADGAENATFSSETEFALGLRGLATDAVHAVIPYTGTFRVAIATTVPFSVGPEPEVAGFVFVPIGNQFTEVPFTITVRAVDEFGNTVTSFSDPIELDGDPLGPIGAPLATPAFVSGVLQDYPVTYDSAGEFVLSARSLDGILSGASNPFLVQALPGPWSLTLNADPADGGSVSAGGIFSHGTLQPILATPAAGQRFVHWIGSGISDPYASESAVLMVADRTLTAVFRPLDPEETLLSWQQRYFLRNAGNAAISGPDIDFNKDGYSNLLAYAFGMNPVIADAPKRGPRMERGSNGLNLTYFRRTNNPNLRVEVQQSSSLQGGWVSHVADPADQQITPVEQGIERVDLRLPSPQTPGSLTFFRVQVILTD